MCVFQQIASVFELFLRKEHEIFHLLEFDDRDSDDSNSSELVM